MKKDPKFTDKTSHILAPYISALEASGARTVPLLYDNDLTEELKKVEHLNGVFYPGGDGTPEYFNFGKAVLDKVL